MKDKMRESFEKLFPQNKLPPLAGFEVGSADLSHRLMLDAAANGDYAKHCLSFMAGAESCEPEIRRLRVKIAEQQAAIDKLHEVINKKEAE